MSRKLTLVQFLIIYVFNTNFMYLLELILTCTVPLTIAV